MKKMNIKKSISLITAAALKEMESRATKEN